ncbi:TetR/AcrR family transcriptional regulator [Rhizobium jaguaris]|uniref:TetR/AcrR family transcriptional regulator n=1 Tax=Rhizobium jaguaris TaxID=1312183 RepID=UPI0013C5209B|nr:TetR/AcrR family transcriptional regulator [Rhizobium jaguaris]
MDAAESVVRKAGPTRLTLDAVAAEAGVSKASVIYDYKTKEALIKAIVRRRTLEEDGKHRAALEKVGHTENAHMMARLAVAGEDASEEDKSVIPYLCAAFVQDDQLRMSLQESYLSQIETILQASPNPKRALLSFLALEGLKSLEFLVLLQWPDEQRKDIIKDITDLLCERDTGIREPVHPPIAGKLTTD